MLGARAEVLLRGGDLSPRNWCARPIADPGHILFGPGDHEAAALQAVAGATREAAAGDGSLLCLAQTDTIRSTPVSSSTRTRLREQSGSRTKSGAAESGCTAGQ